MIWLALWPVVGIIAACVMYYFLWLSKKKHATGTHEDNQTLFTKKKATWIILFSLFAGFLSISKILIQGILSSLLGIGGGILLSPMMLELGVIPDATAATSSFMIVWFCVFPLDLLALDISCSCDSICSIEPIALRLQYYLWPHWSRGFSHWTSWNFCSS